jgi:hypothetical protein
MKSFTHCMVHDLHGVFRQSSGTKIVNGEKIFSLTHVMKMPSVVVVMDELYFTIMVICR